MIKILFALLLTTIVTLGNKSDEFLSKATNLDDSIRTSFQSLTSEAQAIRASSQTISLVNLYSSQKHYNRALKLLSAIQPSLPIPFYDFKLAIHEATLHYCVSDPNHAIKILHEARDRTLKYLGKLSKEELSDHFDVLNAVYGMTSKLVSWYKQNGADEGADALATWMVEQSQYRNQNQLPSVVFVSELRVKGPFPELKEFYGHFDELDYIVTSMEKWDYFRENDNWNWGYDTDCNVDIQGSANVSAIPYFKTVKSSDSIQLHELGSVLNRVGSENGNETKFLQVTEIALKKLSPGGKVRQHFGRTNTELAVIYQQSSCVSVAAGGQMSKFDAKFILFDDSFGTEIENICADEEAVFLRVDFQHPHFRGAI